MKDRRDILLQQILDWHLVLLQTLAPLDDLADEAYAAGEETQIAMKRGMIRLQALMAVEMKCIAETVSSARLKGEPKS